MKKENLIVFAILALIFSVGGILSHVWTKGELKQEFQELQFQSKQNRLKAKNALLQDCNSLGQFIKAETKVIGKKCFYAEAWGERKILSYQTFVE